jgi:glycosyltransferase involved in cell wall biosynthesis
MFWRIGALLQKPSGPAARARVAVVIPARDEGDVIAQAVASIRAQQFDGELLIFVADDNSSDATAEIAAAHGATVIQAGTLPSGWTGKLWAAEQGVRAAVRTDPDYLLLTDADIVHGPTSIRDLIA